MKLWNYIQILGQKKQGWLFKKDNAEERIVALAKILEFGYPSTIQHLIPFLKDNNKEFQQNTCQVIIELFKKIETKNTYYETLKHCNISVPDLDLYSQLFSPQQCITLYAIASLNRSGYIREIAIEKLTETNNEKAIPFIIYRLADWVHPVKLTALKSIDYFKKTEFIHALVENLPLFEWLRKVERTDLNSIHSEIINFVVIKNKTYVIEHFKSFPDRARILIAKHLSHTKTIDSNYLNILLNDKNDQVRNNTLSHFDKLTPPEIDKLLKDKSARVRLQTLYNLKTHEEFPKIILPFLADNAASIRHFARYTLKNNFPDFAIIYNDNLIKKLNIVGSLSGLAETNGKNYVDSIVPYLDDNKIKIRKLAFLALKQLNNDKAYDFAFKHLDSQHVGIRNTIVDYFSNNATAEVLQKARTAYLNGQVELKKSMLKLFSRVGKWATIADIMIGTIDENENIRELSLGYLQRWRNKAANNFIQPKQGELERANEIFQIAFKRHEENKYYTQNPLTGLDFYFR